MCCTAAMASRFSVRLTGSPAARSSLMNPARSSVRAAPAPTSVSRCLLPSTVTSGAAELGIPLPGLGRARGRLGGAPAQRRVLLELLGGLGDVALVLEQDVGRAGGGGGVDLVDAEQQQGARPVDRLGH